MLLVGEHGQMIDAVVAIRWPNRKGVLLQQLVLREYILPTFLPKKTDTTRYLIY